MNKNEVKALVNHVFKLCAARTALQQLATVTPTLSAAMLDIDEQLEQLCVALRVEPADVWAKFRDTGTAVSAVVNHGAEHIVAKHLH